MVHSGSVIVKGEPYIIERNYPFRIGFLNDIHAGSQFGVFPTKWVSKSKGNITFPNAGQRKLNKYLDDYAGHCREVGVNLLFCPGDLTAGYNIIERGKYIIDTDIDEQKAIAASIIASFYKKVPSIEKIYLWSGTGYHGSVDTSDEKGIADILKKDYDVPVEYKEEYSFVELFYGDEKKRLLIMHAAPDAYIYPEQAMGKDMMLYQEGVSKKKLAPVDIIIRAHKHSYIEVHKPTIRSIQLPCFQFFTPYDSALKSFARFQPDIGSIIMLFDDKLRTTIWHFIYDNFINPERYLKITTGKEVVSKRLSKK